ncbi:MAG: DUF2948 family protein [Paracoccaceae bacterium]
MSEDARFEDGREAPLNLGALDGGDLEVISSLVQDAVFPITEMQFYRSERQFAVLLNRLRWEDDHKDRHGVERVQSVLVVSNVMSVASQGIDRSEKDMVLSVLSLSFEPGEDAMGDVLVTLAGDGAIRLSVEALEVQLRDVTRPYRAPSRQLPDHGE